MRPEYFILAAVVLIAIIALARGSKKDKKARSIATSLPDLDQPSDVLTMRLKLPDGNVWPIDYCLDVQRATSGGFEQSGEFWQRYTDTVDLSGIGSDAHETVNLGHDESLRSHRQNLLPAGPGAPTCGHGIARGYFPGHPDLPEGLRSKHIVVMEVFDKVDAAGSPLRTLYADTARELPADGLAVRNVLRWVKDGGVRVRYTYHRPNGAPICDSGWVALPHSQPLTGTDVARALFPAHGTVKATGCSVAWSDTELAPLVPMDITGGEA